MNRLSFFLIIQIFIYVIVFSLLNSNTLSNNNFEFNNSFSYPTIYKELSSTYGNRILYGSQNFHNGIDFLAPEGSEILASESGTISYASFMSDGFGNTIIITHDDNFKSLYCHVSENFIVNIGDYVSKGDVIGYVGPKYLSTGILNGNTTGPHLHFSIYLNNSTVNPLEYLTN